MFPNPDTFDMHRKRGSEEALGYGYGSHRCIAEWLARAELEIVFGESYFMPEFVKVRLTDDCVLVRAVATLFQKLPNLKLATPASDIEYTPPTKDVGITKLPVLF